MVMGDEYDIYTGEFVDADRRAGGLDETTLVLAGWRTLDQSASEDRRIPEQRSDRR
jgi:hypothetical protein